MRTAVSELRAAEAGVDTGVVIPERDDVALEGPEEAALVQELRERWLLSRGETTEEGEGGEGRRLDDDDDAEENVDFWLLACLRARKYNVESALERFFRYIAWRESYGIPIGGDQSSLEEEEEEEEVARRIAFEAPPEARDRVHNCPLVFADFSVHERGAVGTDDTVRSLHNSFERALRQSPVAQARGVVVVNNLTNVGIRNLDPRVMIRMVRAFNGILPIRLKKIILVNPPWFFGIVFPLMKRLLRPKLRARIHVLYSLEELEQGHIAAASLIEELGGTLVLGRGKNGEGTATPPGPGEA